MDVAGGITLNLTDEAFLKYIEVFFAVFVRCLGVVMSVPVFGSRGVPIIAKAGIALFLAGLLAPLAGRTTGVLRSAPWSYGMAIVGELLLGLAMGYIINLVFTAVQVAGSFIDLPIGFRAANLVDPQWGYPVPLIGHFKYFVALTLFLVLDGHHMILRGLASSLEILPAATFSPGGVGRMAGVVVDFFARSFVMALQMSLPVGASLFLTDCAFAMLARASPQINVFLLGFILKIIVGIAILALAFPYFIEYLRIAIEGIYQNLVIFLNSL